MFLGFLVAVSAGSAATILVPADQPTIQAGIAAAVDGDSVVVAAGTYSGSGNRDIDFGGKDIIVFSPSGPESTVIDCGGLGRGFFFHSGEGRSSKVAGFRIINGNVGEGRGGGMFCSDGSSPSILDCHFVQNEASIGGGISCEGAMPLIEGCVFTENSGIHYGGGIHCDHGSNPTITHCEFYRNESLAGAGIRCGHSSPEITGCTFEDNHAAFIGGGIECRLDSSPDITGCIFRDNESGDAGGGVRISESSFPHVTRCLMEGNLALNGGAVSVFEAEPTFTHCTMSRNQASIGSGGCILIDASASACIVNSILRNDEPSEIEILGGSIQVSYSDVEGGWMGMGNIDEDPLFVGGSPFDYHLTESSPCIDAGDPGSPPDPDVTRADMGLYFFDQSATLVLTLWVVPDTTYYHRGERPAFTVTAANHTDSTVYFQGWTEVETPWGLILSPLLGPLDAFLGAHEAYSTDVVHYPPIPRYTPFGGPYIYRVVLGAYPDSVYDEDSFEFFVVP
jgi:predicted outer membrane repeat protein